MTLVAGLIPIGIFAILIDRYGREFPVEVRGVIEQAYVEQSNRSESILRDAVGTLIQQKAHDVALQLDLVLRSYPYMALEDLQKDKEFRKLAVQKVGQSGYTGLIDAKTGVFRFHKERSLENRSPGMLRKKHPELWSILEKSRGGKETNGYFNWGESQEEQSQQFIYIAPLREKTADGIALSAAVITSLDTFTQPVRDAQSVSRRTADYLTSATERLFDSFRYIGLFYMCLGILIISLLAFVVGHFFSRAITQLREVTRKVNEGDLTASVKTSMSGEVKTLAEDFNRMIRQLAETTVSKKLLQESEKRLIDTNFNLQHEVAVRTQAEQALAAEKEQLAVTLRSITEGVITTDRTGEIILMNKAAEEITGWSQGEIAGRSLEDILCLIDERTRERSENPVHRMLNGVERELRERTDILVTRDGIERIVDLSGAAIKGKDETILGAVIVFRDITEKRKLETELLTVRKLESVGTLAGGIAHDFNNLLAVILGNVSFCKALIDPADKLYQRLTDAENATLRGKDLTYRLLTFSKGGEPLKKVMFLKNIIRDVSRLALSGSNVKFSFKISDDLYQAEIDEGQIRQVIHNIVMNAKEAMLDGGKVTIRADNIVVHSQDNAPLAEGEYVRISIEDQGQGIPEEDIPRIFDPYFTTKEIGNTKGMGLGLAICYSIVKNHNGYITAESRRGEGTAIHVYLPASVKDSDKERIQTTKTTETKKNNILYMDDEEALRNIVGQMLTHLGYDVSFAADGDEAIRLYSHAFPSEKPFDLVIMDLTIPGGMGGKEAILKLRDIDPAIKAIVSSGYSNDPIMNNFRQYGFAGAIAKPYAVEILGETIRQVLADRGL